MVYGARALPGMPAASKRDARRRSAVSTRLRSCPNRRHLGGCCGAAAGGAATGRQIQRSGHPPAIHWKGTKAPLSAIHRRSFPSLKLATPSMDEGDVASSFVPGTVRAGRHRTLRSTLALHPSYRRPGVQPSPSLSEIILDFGTCEVMNNMQYVICNGAMTALRWASSTQTRRSSSARRRSPTVSLSLREWLHHPG